MQETRVLRHRPVFDLKWSLLRQVAAVALLCFLGAAAISIYRAEKETVKANRDVAVAVGRFLEMPKLLMELQPDLQRRIGIQQRFREMGDSFLDQVMSPGQCVQVDEAGKNVISSCVGFHSPSGDAPAWFSAFY